LIRSAVRVVVGRFVSRGALGFGFALGNARPQECVRASGTRSLTAELLVVTARHDVVKRCSDTCSKVGCPLVLLALFAFIRCILLAFFAGVSGLDRLAVPVLVGDSTLVTEDAGERYLDGGCGADSVVPNSAVAIFDSDSKKVGCVLSLLVFLAFHSGGL